MHPAPCRPARSFDKFEGKASTSAQSALSNVQTVRLAADAGGEGKAFGPYLSVLISGQEDALSGLQATFAAVVFGEVLDGPAAERAGLVWRCVPDDELLPTARTMAGKALHAPIELTKKITSTIRGIGALDDHREAMLVELEPQAWSTEQPHFQEKVAALRRKISSR